MHRLKQFAAALFVLVGVFAFATFVQAAVDSWRCGRVAAAQVVPQAATYPITCRYVRVTDMDTATSVLVIAVGPHALPDSLGQHTAPRWPLAILCAGDPL